MSPKIVRKIHAFRGELISRLKKAVETFEIIDNTYQEIIQVGALKCNNQHMFNKFQTGMRETQDKLGSMYGKAPLQAFQMNQKHVGSTQTSKNLGYSNTIRPGDNSNNLRNDIYTHDAEEILHHSDSEEDIKEHNRQMSKYLNK